MSEPSEITCPECEKTFPEKALRMKHTTTESCPFCNCTIRDGESWVSTNVQLQIATDIQAIDTWLDNYVQATGKKLVQRRIKEHKRQRLWSLETDYPFACEVAYEFRRPDFVAVRFVKTDLAERVFADETRMRLLCAVHGLDPYGVLNTETDFGASTAVSAWGVAQYLTIDNLCEDRFEPLFQRFAAAMSEALTVFGTG